jgi:hypothetical protein
MVDFIVFNAVAQSGRVLWDLVMANKQLAENRELVTAVSEVNSKLIGAQSVALEAQQEQAALAQRVHELEQKIMTLENWEREAERYELTAIASEVFAHCLKPGMEQGEPPHYLCANCYGDHKKSILQSDNSDGKMARTNLVCLRCKGSIMIPHSDTTGGSQSSAIYLDGLERPSRRGGW